VVYWEFLVKLVGIKPELVEEGGKCIERGFQSQSSFESRECPGDVVEKPEVVFVQLISMGVRN
jgi:hypothetical protein